MIDLSTRIVTRDPRCLTIWTQAMTGIAKPKDGILVTGSDVLGPGERWRMFGIRWFATAAAAWSDATLHGCLARVVDSEGFIYNLTTFDIYGVTDAAGHNNNQGQSSPWMTFGEGIVGPARGSPLYMQYVNSAGVSLASGYLGVTMHVAIERALADNE